jgi:hypothetical protein
MLPVVTGVTEDYIPGARALWNSVQRNAPGELDMYCMVWGDVDAAIEVERIGYKVIHNPSHYYPEDIVFPKGGQWTNYSELAMQAMYCRMLLPLIFATDSRVLWLDADTLVMDNIASDLMGLDFKGHPTAQPFLRVRDDRANGGTYRKHCCAILLYDIPAWMAGEWDVKFWDMMRNYEGAPGGVVETLMNELFRNDVASLPKERWHVNGKRQLPRRDTKILHFPSIHPWDTDQYVTRPKPENVIKTTKLNWEPYR